MRDVCRGRWTLALAAAAISGCSSPKPPASSAAGGRDSGAAATSLSAAAPGPLCPPTGLWARCSVLYRLEREGLAPHVDTTAKPDAVLRGRGFVIKIGRMASLDVYLYPDSAARIADEKALDRTQFVSADAPLTIRRERTLIENANLVALLTSLNDRQRERVSDALTAGAPQPPRR